MSQPKFSIVISCYNQRNFIADAVESALSQIHPNREVIVVDDASTDGSYALLESFGEAIRLLRMKTNQGRSVASNAGTAIAQGDYLVYLDGDDVLKPWALTVYDQIIQSRQPVVILGSLDWFEGTVPLQPEAETPNKIKFVSYDNWVQKDRSFRSSGSALIVEHRTFEAIGGWKKEAWPFDDFYLEAELARSGRTILILDPPTIFYRAHTSNTISNITGLITGIYNFVAAAKSNRRFNGNQRSLASSALIGGPAFWVVQRAFQTGRRWEGLRLFARVWPWIAAAAFNRLFRVFGQRPAQTISVRISPTPKIQHARAG